jgi:drug/metabolite transporter (DMT)-like permease
MFAVSYVYCNVKKIDVLLIPRNVSLWLLARCIWGFVGVTTYFLAIFMMPFGIAIVLIFTQPIFVAIITNIVNKEVLTKFEYLSIFFAMLGVIMLTNPQWIFFWITFDN